MQRHQHGGASNALWDFSTNANCLGPCTAALEQIMAVDLSPYPQSGYLTLVQSLADWHGVQVSRIVLGASASELIMRLSMALRLMRSSDHSVPFVVNVPHPAYGDYAVAALACGHTVGSVGGTADAEWQALPSSPLGKLHAVKNQHNAQLHWLDCAYLPLLLSGQPPRVEELDQTWQIWTPNKALGLCGVRGAYAIAPINVRNGFENFASTVLQLEPSWVLGAASVALLQAWVSKPVQTWLADACQSLRRLKVKQTEAMNTLNINFEPSQTNFMCVQLHPHVDEHMRRIQALSECGIAVRNTANMGLPGWVRMRVHTEEAQAAFIQAYRNL